MPSDTPASYIAQTENSYLFRKIKPFSGKVEDFGNLTEIRTKLGRKLYNSDKFPEQNDTIIVVQIHNRPLFYSTLISSLRNAVGIEKVDLVISSDYWSQEMNSITESIDFCRLHQIFYPLSASFYQREFPSDSPEDCSRRSMLHKDGSNEKNICFGQPDTYGNYRESKVVNIKHHWFWKLNYIRQNFKNYSKIILLEEDHIITPDFLQVNTKMEKVTETRIHDTPDFIHSLGTYKYKLTSNPSDWRNLISTSFNSGKHNMGMILRKHFLETITSDEWTERFCNYDDYNWDWSLFYTIMTGPKWIRVFYPSIPRVFHLGDTCGVHHEKGECNDSTIRDFESKMKSFQKFYFPPELKQVLSMTEFRTPRKLKPNGGWKDERDIELCKLFQRTTKPEDLELFRLGILKKISSIGK